MESPLWRLWGLRILFILWPSRRIGADVSSDPFMGAFVADDVLEIVDLPRPAAERLPSGWLDTSNVSVRRRGREPSYNRAKGRSFRSRSTTGAGMVDEHDAMDTIRHDNGIIRLNAGELRGSFLPSQHHFSRVVQ